jgi:hypothetical protein
MSTHIGNRRRRRAIWSLVLAFCMLVVGFPGIDHVLAAESARMYVAPASGNFAVGGITFDVQIRVDSGPDGINAVEAVLTFPPDLLMVTGPPSVVGSFLEYWMPDTTYDNVLGVVHVTGGRPSGFEGGFTGDGLVATVQFCTRSTAGTASVSVDLAQSHVLRAVDNTEVLATVTGGSYTLATWVSGDLLLTGGLRITGPAVELEYELMYGGARVDVSSSTVQSITVSYGGGTPSSVVPDATGNVWFDALDPAGTYDFVFVMLTGVTYHASIVWGPTTATFVQTGGWQKVSGTMFIPWSCGTDLHLSSAIAVFGPALANLAVVDVPTGAGLLFSISHVYGLYTFVIVAGQSVTIATLTQPRTGDLNHDGVIAIEDVSLLVAAWGPVQANNQASIDANLTVDIIDVSILLSRWTPVG